MATTYRVRFNRIEPRANAEGKITSYRVHWTVNRERMKATLGTIVQAEAFAAELRTAIGRGEAFDETTGLPVSHERKTITVRWYECATAYAAAKWPYASPNHRRGISESLTDATEVLAESHSSPPPRAAVREAMRWATSTHIEHPDDSPPPSITDTVRWLERHTVPMTAFDERGGKGTALSRAVLDRISRKQDRTLASGSTFLRKRAVLNNLMAYAIEAEILPRNPLKTVRWVKPKISAEVDERTVVNAEQGRRLLSAFTKLGETGQRLQAFFGCMYYAALRPEECTALMCADLLSLPEKGWGKMRLSEAEPMPGKRWTGNGTARERRALKHRAQGATRTVPIHPELVALLRAHLERFPNANGYVFRGPRGGKISDSTYLPYFRKARTAAFTPAEAASPLADVPYALRHAAVSQWLAAGVQPKQVAQWAGHSVDVLMRIYWKVIEGLEEHDMRRIEDAMQHRP